MTWYQLANWSLVKQYMPWRYHVTWSACSHWQYETSFGLLHNRICHLSDKPHSFQEARLWDCAEWKQRSRDMASGEIKVRTSDSRVIHDSNVTSSNCSRENQYSTNQQLSLWMMQKSTHKQTRFSLFSTVHVHCQQTVSCSRTNNVRKIMTTLCDNKACAINVCLRKRLRNFQSS